MILGWFDLRCRVLGGGLILWRIRVDWMLCSRGVCCFFEVFDGRPRPRSSNLLRLVTFVWSITMCCLTYQRSNQFINDSKSERHVSKAQDRVSCKYTLHQFNFFTEASAPLPLEPWPAFPSSPYPSSSPSP